jgi:hypothetical protein
LAALGGAGLLAALGGTAQADVGGGPASDEIAELLARTYEGPESELPAPGIEGRRYLVTDTGGTYPQWSLLRDQGDAWAQIELSLGAINAGSASVGSLTSDTVNTDEMDKVRTASPGNIQSVIDDVAALSNIDMGTNTGEGLVKLEPKTVYDEGSEIHVKPGVHLDMNGAVLTNSADHNLIFLDNGGHLHNGWLELQHDAATAGKAGIVLDSARASNGKYSSGIAGGKIASHATADATIIGDTTPQTMDALQLIDDSTAGAITVGCEFDLNIYLARDGIRFDANNFINGVAVTGFVTGCVNCVHHVGSAPAESIIKSNIQPNGERAIWNETTANSVTQVGRLWDPGNASTNAIVGPNIDVVNHGGKPNLSQNSDGSTGQRNWAIRNGSIYWEDVTDDVDWEWASGFNGALNLIGDSLLLQFKPDKINLQSPVVNLREISNPGPADLSGGEWAWDATNGRWLFKDSAGTAHYFSPDGTL